MGIKDGFCVDFEKDLLALLKKYNLVGEKMAITKLSIIQEAGDIPQISFDGFLLR